MPQAATSGQRRLELALWSGLAVVLVLVAAVGVERSLHRRTPPGPALPVLGQLPEFTLLESGGRTAGSADLKGAIWVADFIFTRCTGICPVLTSAMGALHHELAGHRLGGVRLVSFTVDPLHDRPDVLKAYAASHKAPTDKAPTDDWWFLTGDRATIHALVRDGFRLAVADAPPGSTPAEGELVTHSDRLVLIDGELRVRGYYHGTEEGAVAQVIADIERLGSETRR